MKATILLIDDDPQVRDSLGQTLRVEGCDVTFASNGQEALNALRATGFDLVLLDVDMPTRDRWDTLGQIITNSLSIPLVIITTHPEEQQMALQKGVMAVLEKPLEMSLLLKLMERLPARPVETSSPPIPTRQP